MCSCGTYLRSPGRFSQKVHLCGKSVWSLSSLLKSNLPQSTHEKLPLNIGLVTCQISCSSVAKAARRPNSFGSPNCWDTAWMMLLYFSSKRNSSVSRPFAPTLFLHSLFHNRSAQHCSTMTVTTAHLTYVDVHHQRGAPRLPTPPIAYFANTAQTWMHMAINSKARRCKRGEWPP